MAAKNLYYLCNKLKKTKNMRFLPLTLVSNIRFCSPVSVGFPFKLVNL
jgi:hypothetical protein